MAIKGQCRSFPSLLLLLSLVGGKYIYKAGDDNMNYPPPCYSSFSSSHCPRLFSLCHSEEHKAGDDDDGDGDKENYHYL